MVASWAWSGVAVGGGINPGASLRFTIFSFALYPDDATSEVSTGDDSVSDWSGLAVDDFDG